MREESVHVTSISTDEHDMVVVTYSEGGVTKTFTGGLVCHGTFDRVDGETFLNISVVRISGLRGNYGK